MTTAALQILTLAGGLIVAMAAAAPAAAQPCPTAKADAPAVGTVPAKYQPFYKKYIDANGIGIVAEGAVCDRSLQLTYLILTHMLSKRPDIRRTLVTRDAHIAIVGEGHDVLATPEFSHVHSRRPVVCGMTGFARNPTTALCEANLIGWDERSRRHVSEMIHEIGHLIMNVGVDRQTHQAIEQAYEHAREKGLFQPNGSRAPSYAMSNAAEYWAMATMAWFSAADWSAPINSTHEKNRKTQAAHDPEIDAILRQIYPEDDWDFPQT